jgi:hypothetical protein
MTQKLSPRSLAVVLKIRGNGLTQSRMDGTSLRGLTLRTIAPA